MTQKVSVSRNATQQDKCPYVSPKVDIVSLRPEEQLLACLKLNQGSAGSCWGGARTPNKS